MVIQDISNKGMGFVYISRIPHKPKQTNQIVKPYISNLIYPNRSYSRYIQFGQYLGYKGLNGLKVFLDMMVLPRIPLINIKPIEIVKGEI